MKLQADYQNADTSELKVFFYWHFIRIEFRIRVTFNLLVSMQKQQVWHWHKSRIMEFLTWSFPLALLRNSSTASTACWNRFPLLIFIISSLCAWYGFSCSTLIQALAKNTQKEYHPHYLCQISKTSPQQNAMKISICFHWTVIFEDILLTTSSS